MRRTLTRSLIVLTFAVAILALLGVQGSAGKAASAPIDLGAEVEASQCAPCHLQLGEATYPGLIFSHGNHLMVACTSCHYRQAHVGGTTYRPPMESCFNCHGISHGPQGELASSKCADCHTPAFRLRPRSHTKAWPGKAHAKASAKTANSCLMCHDDVAKDCDACHEKRGLKVAVKPARYVPVLPATSKRAVTPVYPDRPTTISQCVNCHPDLDSSDPARTGVIFAHDPHLRRDFACAVCHDEFGHKGEDIDRPDMRSCYRCHGLTHAANGLVAAEECGKCHPKDFTLKPSDHTKRFVNGAHGKPATKDGSYCAMCHKADFCVSCHMGRRRRADGSPGKPVIPATHAAPKWKGEHGGLFLKQQGACGSCHDEPSCMTCHVTPMPHPINWLAQHGKDTQRKVRQTKHMLKDGRPKEGADCNVCHTDRRTCQECHHSTVKGTELVAKNCAPCHDEMKRKPATSIRNKGFAEHAVHFDTYKKKGEPYVCEDCHVDFRTFKAPGGDPLQQAHDLRLCYECHGKLDYKRLLIAPYSGAELCRRCHADLNI